MNDGDAPRMKVLLVYAHPEPGSLNGALRDAAVSALRAAGHEVRVSDLYAMGWKAVADGADFPARPAGERLFYADASRRAFAGGAQAPDVAAEQEKLLWCDTLLVQFPLWWFSMPAILKGWVDRVFAYGLAYGVGPHGGKRWGDRYGEGKLSGRRAMLIVTAGGREPHYGPRGVNGPIDDLLFPIHHGILFYPGMAVLPPFVVYQADRLAERDFPPLRAALEARLAALATTAPIPYRTQNGGDYDDQQVLAAEHAPGARGFAIHLAPEPPAPPRRPWPPGPPGAARPDP
ncbi:MAG TPA: NAD(P)H-dependent oxidoreductase [Polyangiaceae bacterium]|nr:NAD(P)H-dependent oxidoreductase [Polyangiaceae bacterium]